ncbi:YdeI/OmpD-associated family protein [Gangjinia marincola]|uniref:YdeI/OmpD-associated family protein n=1 Tax=Gangjinia marincola TaxID=578463 RepID=A0ABN1MCR0_9FLAO
MATTPELYFENDQLWTDWLDVHHATNDGVYLIFYKLECNIPTMRWEEAVKVALCYGWIDSTVKSLGNGKRRQYFCPRKPKSVWSKVNKGYVEELIATGRMKPSGLKAIQIAKENGSWTALDEVEAGIIPPDLQQAFDNNPQAYKNYSAFSFSYQKNYLYWLNQAKREETRQKRITAIIDLCRASLKSRGGR